MSFHQSPNTYLVLLTAYMYDHTSNPGPIGVEHFHKNYELLIAVCGQSKVCVSGNEYILQEGEAIIVHPYLTHKLQVFEGSKLWCSTFNANLLPAFSSLFYNKLPTSVRFLPSPSTTAFFLERMQSTFGSFKTWIKLSPSQLIVAKSCLYAVVSEYVSQVSATDAATHKNKDALVMMITSYLEENFKKNITLYDVASAVGYNYQYLSKNFKSLLGESFKRILNRYRIEHAYTLLTQTALPITQIAYDCGFQSQRSFNHVCREFFSLSPTQIREQHEKQELK